MADIVDKAARSKIMSGIRGSNTLPEIIVRRYLHAAGLRFRLHAPDLPGRPDVVFRKRNVAIFIHGCFWHRHTNCRFAYVPKSRKAFWAQKFASNVRRDRIVHQKLRRAGWCVLTIWECEVNDPKKLTRLARRVITAPIRSS